MSGLSHQISAQVDSLKRLTAEEQAYDKEVEWKKRCFLERRTQLIAQIDSMNEQYRAANQGKLVAEENNQINSMPSQQATSSMMDGSSGALCVPIESHMPQTSVPGSGLTNQVQENNKLKNENESLLQPIEVNNTMTASNTNYNTNNAIVVETAPSTTNTNTNVINMETTPLSTIMMATSAQQPMPTKREEKKSVAKSRMNKCAHLDCQKFRQSGTSFCIAHGGGRRCTFEGCTRAARGAKFCAAHGGGKRCIADGCTRSCVGKSGMCISHGGGKRCKSSNCPRSAQSPSDFCVRHGGGRQCSLPSCGKVARSGTQYCRSHQKSMAKTLEEADSRDQDVAKSLMLFKTAEIV